MFLFYISIGHNVNSLTLDAQCVTFYLKQGHNDEVIDIKILKPSMMQINLNHIISNHVIKSTLLYM